MLTFLFHIEVIESTPRSDEEQIKSISNISGEGVQVNVQYVTNIKHSIHPDNPATLLDDTPEFADNNLDNHFFILLMMSFLSINSKLGSFFL